jgi:hypothetical protein
MNFVDLVQFVVAREKWTEGHNLKENATNSPIVHFVIVIPVGK